MSAPLFAPLPRVTGGFRCVHADPPIRFRSNSRERPGRNAQRHYRCYDYADFEALPVADVVAGDAYLFLWVPGPWLALGAHVGLIEAWGFKPSGVAFTWVKQYPSGAWFVGTGLTTRKGTETVILGRRGKPQRLAADVREVIVAPVREHSRKPDEIYQRIERFCAGPRLDLFARQQRDGWVSYGDQTSRFDFEGPRECSPHEYAADRATP
jgi:N6-adenosine-specific RNA methylase IME4